MRISVDFDGVLVDLISETIKEMNKRIKGKVIKYSDVNCWDWFTKTGLLDNEELRDIFLSRSVLKCKQVDKNSSKIIDKLKKKHEVDVVTSRIDRPFLYQIMEEQLEEMNINYDSLRILNGEGKEHLHYHLFIDDNPNLAWNLEEERHPFFCHMILYNQPWNWMVECEQHSWLHRANNWKQVYEIIKKI